VINTQKGFKAEGRGQKAEGRRQKEEEGRRKKDIIKLLTSNFRLQTYDNNSQCGR